MINDTLLSMDCQRKAWYYSTAIKEYKATPLKKVVRNFVATHYVSMLEQCGDFHVTESMLNAKNTAHNINSKIDAIGVKDGGIIQIIHVELSSPTDINKILKSGLRFANSKLYSLMQLKLLATDASEGVLVLCNTQDWVTTDVVVEANESAMQSLVMKAQNFNEDAPKVSDSPAYFACKNCNFSIKCHG